MMSQKFTKDERLKSLKSIEHLFTAGSNVFSYPIKAVYRIVENEEKSLPKIAISVPKRNRKKAHDRNIIKRRIREAYRLNNSDFKTKMDTFQNNIEIMFIYIEKTELDYASIESSMIKCLEKLLKVEN